MRLFSVSTLGRKALETSKRFPLPILAACAATASVIYLVHQQGAKDPLNHFLERLSMALYLFMLLAISVALGTERFAFNKAKRTLYAILSLVSVGFYFLSLPADQNGVSMARFALYIIALHLSVSFAPFVIRSEMNGLWQYNKSLFLHFLTGAIYSGVLYVGLALALAAVNILFGVKITPESYLYLWLVIAGIFNTWFFLSGAPENIPSLEQVTDYPKSLKIFAVHVLIPLITVYLVILYAYGAKILITSDWPVGWVAYMVIAFSIFGILSFLLIYPLRDDAANPWVKFYSRLFYYSLILPIILLFISIFKRITMYGVTEDRYFVVLLALWLSFITVYLILTSGRRIRMIPLSLCIVAILSSFGPWGAFAISRNSQTQELTNLFNKNQLLVSGKVDVSKTHDVDERDVKRIKSIVSYIDRMHGYQELQPFFSENVDSLLTSKKLADNQHSYLEHAQTFLDLMNLKETFSSDTASATYFYRVVDHSMFTAPGYDMIASFGNAAITSYPESGPASRDSLVKEEFVIGADTVHYTYSQITQSISLTYKNLEPLVLNTKPMFDALPANKEDFPPEMMTISAENAQWKARICFRAMNVTKGRGKTVIRNADALLMLKFLEVK